MAGQNLITWAEAAFLAVLSAAAIIAVGFMLARSGLVANAIPIVTITLVIVGFSAYTAYRLIRHVFKGR